MTTLLEQAFAEASKLSEREQDAIAFLVLEELASERKGGGAAESPSDKLAQLIAEARADLAAGRVRPLSADDV